MAKELKQRKKGETEELKPAVAGTKTRSRQSPPKAAFSHWPVFCKFVAVLLFLYYCGMMFTRLIMERYQFRGYWAFVDTLWVCNLNLLLASGAILLGYPALVGATINAVFIPHVLWVIDVIAYWITGSFPIRLAAYVAWPDTPVAEIVTSTHHVWFVPLLLAVLHKNGGVPFKGWPIAVFMISPILLVSYFFPEEIILDNGEPYYLNVNMAHGWWRDMTSNWPWSLIPKQNPQYMIFLNAFIATQFTLSFIFVLGAAKLFIKRH